MISTLKNLCAPTGLAALVSVSLIKAATLPVVVGRPATIVFAPWVGASEAVARATVGARLLARGGTRFSITVIPERPDYVTTLSGAWLVTGLPDPIARRAGCAASDRASEAAKS